MGTRNELAGVPLSSRGSSAKQPKHSPIRNSETIIQELGHGLNENGFRFWQWVSDVVEERLRGFLKYSLYFAMAIHIATAFLVWRIFVSVEQNVLYVGSSSDPLTLGKKVRIEGTVRLATRSGAARGEAKAWAAKEDAKGHMCACGCGGRIRVTARQFKTGVPRWLRAHHFGLE